MLAPDDRHRVLRDVQRLGEPLHEFLVGRVLGRRRLKTHNQRAIAPPRYARTAGASDDTNLKHEGTLNSQR